MLDQRRELSSLSREKEDLLGMLDESAQHVTRLEGVIKVERQPHRRRPHGLIVVVTHPPATLYITVRRLVAADVTVWLLLCVVSCRC